MNRTFPKSLISLEAPQIPSVNILGVQIAAINMQWLKKFLLEHVKNLQGEYICVSNVHTTVTAYEDPFYCTAQNEALMAIPDGGPLSSIGRKRGFSEMQRCTGPGLMGEIFQETNGKAYSHFFYGSTEETLSQLKRKLEEKYPKLIIAGMYSPPFRPMTPDEDAVIINQINSADPDFIWVGLGAPKQELWMHEHKNRLNGLMIGVGAGFDYWAGNIRRAPRWMQDHNMEWFYRLMQDPKRLFKRYCYTNTKFIWNAVIRGK